jgi:S1-C subfamily serine protease
VRVIIAASAVLAACSTTPHSDSVVSAPSYSKLKIEQLRMLSQSEPARALEAIAAILGEESAQRPMGGPSDEELTSLATDAEAAIETEYRSALSSKDYPAALVRLDSLKALSEQEGLSALLSRSAAAEAAAWRVKRSSLLEKEAEDFYAKGQSTPALLVYLSALEAGRADTLGVDSSPPGTENVGILPPQIFSFAELSLWADRAFKAHDRRSLTLLCQELSARSVALPAGAEEFLATRDTMAKMRSGVVTIRVDKGIKIEQGMGMPDRVLGTGFYIDHSGYVLTNYHVIASEVDPKYKGYSHMSVKPFDSPEDRIGAKVVGYDRLLDLALIKVDVVPDYVFSLSDGANLAPGQKIYAIGSPAGLEDTVTSGIVSAVGRKILQTGDAMQVDAALNPGNSGGPLLDESGGAVGVVFAGMPQFQSLNFAIPSAWIIKVLPELFRGGELHRAWLGLSLAKKESGPSIDGIEVTYRHPSIAAGVEEGDRLLDIGGEKPKDIGSAQAMLLHRGSGGLVRVRVASGGKERIELRYLAERPFLPLDSAVRLDRQDRLFPVLFGMSLTPLPGSLFDSSSYSVAKVWPGSIADESGLSENDPISLKRFFVDREQQAVFIQIYVKKRKAGFLESIIQIPASLEISDFI